MNSEIELNNHRLIIVANKSAIVISTVSKFLLILEEESSSRLDPLHLVGPATRRDFQTSHQLVAVRAVIQGQGDALGKVVGGWRILGYPGNHTWWDGADGEGVSLVLQQPRPIKGTALQLQPTYLMEKENHSLYLSSTGAFL